MPTQKKVDIVKNLTQKIQDSKSIILADYRGLKHKQLEEIRKTLKKSGAELVIAKNRLILRALGEKAEKVNDLLTEPTAVLFSYEDEVSPVQSLLSFFKTSGAGKAKGGILTDTMLSEEDIVTLSKLPNKTVMRARVAGQLQAPIAGLHYAMSWNIKKLVYALEAVKNVKN